jgi:hypothetical protein
LLEFTELSYLRIVRITELLRLTWPDGGDWQPYDGPLYLVCTHGRHDRCCALRGRPVAKALAAFKPTHVMVEMQSEAPSFAVAEYQRFGPEMLAKDANEIVQIGYRTARVAGLKAVNGIDEHPKAGEPDYYPYDKVEETAAKFGQTAILDALNAPTVAVLKSFEADQKTHSVGQMLLRINDPASINGDMDSYYGMLAVGDKDQQTGADLNAGWYLRNAKIFGKLMQVAKPGAKIPARVLVVYGGGHGYWLRHFAGTVPGYRNVDVMPYLLAAK